MSFREPRANPLMTRQLIVIAGLSGLVIAVLAAGVLSRPRPRNANPGDTKPPAEGASSAATPDLARGKRLFEGQCARCHGIQGGGGTGANLRRPKLRHAPDDQSLFHVIR